MQQPHWGTSWSTPGNWNGQVVCGPTDPGLMQGYSPQYHSVSPTYSVTLVIHSQPGQVYVQTTHCPGQTPQVLYPLAQQPTWPVMPNIYGRIDMPHHTQPPQGPYPPLESTYQFTPIGYGQPGQAYTTIAHPVQSPYPQVIGSPAAPNQLHDGWVKVRKRSRSASNGHESVSWWQTTTQPDNVS